MTEIRIHLVFTFLSKFAHHFASLFHCACAGNQQPFRPRLLQTKRVLEKWIKVFEFVASIFLALTLNSSRRNAWDLTWPGRVPRFRPIFHLHLVSICMYRETENYAPVVWPLSQMTALVCTGCGECTSLGQNFEIWVLRKLSFSENTYIYFFNCASIPSFWGENKAPCLIRQADRCVAYKPTRTHTHTHMFAGWECKTFSINSCQRMSGPRQQIGQQPRSCQHLPFSPSRMRQYLGDKEPFPRLGGLLRIFQRNEPVRISRVSRILLAAA